MFGASLYLSTIIKKVSLNFLMWDSLNLLVTELTYT